MSKTSKVIAVQASGTWEGSYGLMYKFEVTFENGDTGEYSGKNKDQTKFVVGESAEYTLTGGKFPKVKPVYEQGQAFTPQKGLEVQLLIVKQSCLKAAVELCTNDKIQLSQVLDLSNKFVDWVNGAGEKSDYIAAPKQPKKESTDLPF
tara:strand:- start:1957 stop:2400 length:444 start_codon:yes stop_codon:yes gene_type:complete